MHPTVRLPSIEGLRAFETAARLGTFERAGEALDITASAVSKRIATVEELLGTQLFMRSASGLVLTAAGREYLAQVSAALDLLAAVPLHQRGLQRKQRLRISAPPTFAREVLVPHLDSFTTAHPDIELEVVLSIPYLDVTHIEADVDIRHGDAQAASGTVLMRDVVLPLAAPALLARLPPLRTPADLAHAPLLRTPLQAWVPWFREAGLDWPEPTQGTRLVDLGLTLEAAVSGQGVALARPSLARRWLASAALRPVFNLTVEPSTQYYVLPTTSGGAAQPFVQWLADVCEEVSRDALACARAALSRPA
jgi:LysR family glycine cleavage system transcriptional activator